METSKVIFVRQAIINSRKAQTTINYSHVVGIHILVIDGAGGQWWEGDGH